MSPLRLGEPALTLAFWALLALSCAAQVGSPLLLGVDTPQHVALGTTLGHLLRGDAAVARLYEAHWLNYYGLFHALLAVASLWVSPLLAARGLLVLSQVLWAVFSLAVMRRARRPAWYALFTLPIAGGFLSQWGFVNLSLGLPLAGLVYLGWRRWAFGARGARRFAVLSAAGLLVSYSHVLAGFALGASIA